MGVVLVNGVNEFDFDTLVGQTVAQVIGNETVAEVMDLHGNESFRVNGSVPAKNYKLAEGDTVVFTRTAGEKGSR